MALEDFGEVFLGRIHALTASYALLSRECWSPISLREILTEELKPFMSNERLEYRVDGRAGAAGATRGFGIGYGGP